MSDMPCIRPPQPPANPMGRLLVVVLLLVFVTAAHVLGMSAELILLVIGTVVGAAVKLLKALPRLQPRGTL